MGQGEREVRGGSGTAYELDVLPERAECDTVPATAGDVFDENVCRVLPRQTLGVRRAPRHDVLLVRAPL